MEQADRDTVDQNRTMDTHGTIDDSEPINNSEKLMVIPLGKESKKITQVITNDTARQVMELLADQSMSVSDIAHKLDVPLTTIKYNIENLVDVGLAKVERIKYSEKGRQVKVYGPVRKLIVVVPESTDNASIADMLKKYLGVLLAAVFASGIVEVLTRRSGRSMSMKDETGFAADLDPEMEAVSNDSYRALDSFIGEMNNTIQKSLSNETIPAATYFQDVVEEGAALPALIPTPFLESTLGVDPIQNAADLGLTSHVGLWFMLGCSFMIILLMIVDYYRQNK
ncbi:MAG: helix-turn-helix domain-containing protein [ANME-2 cluster archaeon]|nr:helix-turn-helix domain-containing protein [ANME-2 cluster archaeon]MDF1557550.1 winged helix-turn-helix domain-containing protein [ANME-2 cluster archaeon]